VGVMSLEIQRHITNIYDELDRYRNSKDLREIYHWSSCKSFKYNDAFQSALFQIEQQKKLITKNLNQLSESIDDLEPRVNWCKRLVILEKEKNEKFAVKYDKYHERLGAKNELSE
jgi:hypothetical protein